jgi:hypothetical protein
MSATEPVKCSRCKRTLRAAASIAAKVGPRCAAIEAALEGLNPEQKAKALEAIADKAVEPTSHDGVYRLASSKGDAIYIVSVNGNCNCAHGLRAMGTKTCWHPAAARLKAKSRRSLAKVA